ncbi:type II secretion system minor pseudopilin GspK [Erwinia amylovora]|uniref:type II secretion system minor pseudopilin GspK n=1 Tax=Erwinia amylovora TaxID=552 RepID=UPI001444152D|nr:type II secretion system minor pseudopilin GspK [Erwinia amylovora]
MPGLQRGMAMLVVLLMIAIMALLATTANQYGMQAFMRAESSQAFQQSKWNLLSAERWFTTSQKLDQPHTLVRQRQFGEQLIYFELLDRQACFNLNALLPQRVAEKDPQVAPSMARQVFLHMLVNLDLAKPQAEALMQQVIALVKPDPLVNEWRLFDEISQIKQLPAVTPERWRQLQPLLCVMPETRLAVNVNGLTTRQLPLMRALFANTLSVSQLDSLLNSRPQQGWADLSALTKSLSMTTIAPAIVTLQSVLATRSDYYELLMWSDHPTIFAALRSRIQKQDEQYHVTARLYGLSE